MLASLSKRISYTVGRVFLATDGSKLYATNVFFPTTLSMIIFQTPSLNSLVKSLLDWSTS